MDLQRVKNLQAFVNLYNQGHGLLGNTHFDVLCNHVESIYHTHTDTSWRKAHIEEENSEVTSNDESDLEIDEDAEIFEPDEDILQEMGDDNMRVTCEMVDLANEKREEAFEAIDKGDLQRAIELFTDAIKLNPQSSVTYVNRANIFLKRLKPNAAIRDYNKACELNQKSAEPYKWRGKVHMLLRSWKKAADDFTIACKLDCDEETSDLLQQVQKIMENNQKAKQNRELKMLQEKLEKVRLAIVEQERIQREQNSWNEITRTGWKHLKSFFTLFSPRVMTGFLNVFWNPGNIYKY